MAEKDAKNVVLRIDLLFLELIRMHTSDDSTYRIRISYVYIAIRNNIKITKIANS